MLATSTEIVITRTAKTIAAFDNNNILHVGKFDKAQAEALFAVESRCTDLYVLARLDPAQMAPGQEWRMTPVMR